MSPCLRSDGCIDGGRWQLLAGRSRLRRRRIYRGAWSIRRTKHNHRRQRRQCHLASDLTVALTAGAGSFSPGDHVCVEGGFTGGRGAYDEQSTITGVSGGNVTLPLAYYYETIAIFKGGPCGTYISSNADIALNGYRTSYHAIASFTGSDLIYAIPSGNGLNDRALPQTGSEPFTAGGTSDPNAAFQTFCGAEIEANLSAWNTPQIDPNVCAWTAGDTVESPHFPTQKVYGEFILANQNMPNSSSEGMGGINLQLGGMGLAAFAQGINILNSNSATWYTSGGGKLNRPECAYCSLGTWLAALRITAPADSIIKVDSHLPGQTSYNLFDDDGSFGGKIKIDAAGFTFTNGITCFSCQVSAPSFSATANIDTKGAGSTSEMSVVNGTLTSATPSFTQAGYLGSRADFGSVAYGTTTPVTPLLSIITDETYLGADRSE